MGMKYDVFICYNSRDMALRYIGFDNEPKLELNEMELKIGENHLGSLETLLYWNKISKVTGFERKRNHLIATAQGNRNPFVDKLEFADLLWYPV
jgi:endonuclease I